ncbi:MAG: histidinol dehydrogenase [Gemmatimonadetes bacterium]|nr:histidinol dehydrogenase [Gemmatimonadota bacterium]
MPAVPLLPLLRGDAAARFVEERAEPRIDSEARAVAERIIAEVRARGDAALREYTQRFDGVSGTSFEARREDRRNALRNLSAERRRALEAARAHLETFHRAQLREEPPVAVAPGVVAWREFRPVENVGIYVPGGRASYPSSLLMCAIPARLARCPTVVACVPPGPDGRAPEAVLAAAELLGLDAVYAVGGAQAIAALAFGTETIPRVDKIVGPGNRWVTAAKVLVYGLMDLDMPAGPTEIVTLADGTANPSWLAADLVSQAEHAPDALAVCITDDAGLAGRVVREVDRQLEALPDPGVARESLGRSAACVAPDFDTAVAWVNRLAPEHLSIVTRDDEDALGRIVHAGSVFLGAHAPVAAGDYATGTNHVLPTGGGARSFAALSVDDFGKWIQVQRLSPEGLKALADTITTLARWEGFEAHARAVEIRLEEGS